MLAIIKQCSCKLHKMLEACLHVSYIEPDCIQVRRAADTLIHAMDALEIASCTVDSNWSEAQDGSAGKHFGPTCRVGHSRQELGHDSHPLHTIMDVSMMNWADFDSLLGTSAQSTQHIFWVLLMLSTGAALEDHSLGTMIDDRSQALVAAQLRLRADSRSCWASPG